jgi:hypothetical protein
VKGRQYATFVVAAYNSTQDGIALADYVCSGTNDQDTINLATTSSVPSGTKRIVLLEGNYAIDGSISFGSDNTVIEGQGAGTVLEVGVLSSVFDMVGTNFVRVKNLTITDSLSDPDLIVFDATDCMDVVVDGVVFDGVVGDVVSLAGDSSIWFRHDRFTGHGESDLFPSSLPDGLYITDCLTDFGWLSTLEDAHPISGASGIFEAVDAYVTVLGGLIIDITFKSGLIPTNRQTATYPTALPGSALSGSVYG